MSVRTHTAVLSVSSATGRWRVFVGLLNTTDPWPEHVFHTTEIPTPAARTAALTLLGYEPVADAGWEWTEDPAPGDGPVHLLAAMQVRERTEGAS